MAPRHKSRFWRICRVYFRRFRITVWLIVLVLLGALIYLNQVGLPGFVKKPLLEKLRARGVDLQFSRLRLRWYQGIVADNVSFGSADDPSSPQLTLAEVQVQLNLKALTRLQFQVDSLVLRRGRLIWPIVEAGQAPRQLTVENIQTYLRFLPDDQWALDHFTARLAGANIELSGAVAHASAVREWKFFQAKTKQPPPPAGLWSKRLRRLADTLERIHFSAPPELRLNVEGDARDLQSFKVRMLLAAPGADTPWGAVSRGQFVALLSPAGSNGLTGAELTLEAADAQTRWGAITNFHLGIRLASVEGQTNLVKGDLNLSAEDVHTEWGGGAGARFTAQWIHAITNPIPLSGQGQLQCDSAQTQWGSAGRIQFAARLATPPAANPPPACDESWAWWTNLQPYHLDWECRLAELQSPKLQADEITCGGSWRAPRLTVTNLQAKLYHSQLEARAGLDVATRALDLTLASDFDPHRISPLLTESGRRWLDQFLWNSPPQVKGELSVVLPAWTNRQPDWRAEVQPTLRLQGEFNLNSGGAYRRIPVTTAHSHFLYSNMCWHLPDLKVTRPEGRLEAEHRANDRTKDFYWRIASTMDVRIVRPLLEAEQQRGLDLVTFSQPPAIEAEVWGRWHDHERIGFQGRVALTNFAFRGESFTGLQTAVQFTNRLLQFLNPRVQRGAQRLSADSLAADFNVQRIYLSNGFSTAEPLVVARAIGQKIGRTMEPYRFDLPPTVHAHGTIPMHGEEGADLHYDVEGGPFHWWRFNTPHVAGHIHWLGQRLSLTDVRADFYDGHAIGAATFNFEPSDGTEFQFSLATTNTLLQALMADFSTATNRLEGRLGGALVVTKANTADWRTVNGYGDLRLRDGLIWDIPLFGILSPVLNGIVPGLGNSRASAGTCSFVITNGAIRSDDLEIRSPAMRLQYRGTVGLDSRVNARVEAELLRDMWLVGPLVRTVFWPVTKMFEYKVTGTLGNPKMEPVYILPKLMLMPFHPFRTLKGLLIEDSSSSRTGERP